MIAPPTNAGFWVLVPVRCKDTAKHGTPSVAPIIRAVLTTPATTPACAFGAADTATESSGPVAEAPAEGQALPPAAGP